MQRACNLHQVKRHRASRKGKRSNTAGRCGPFHWLDSLVISLLIGKDALGRRQHMNIWRWYIVTMGDLREAVQSVIWNPSLEALGTYKPHDNQQVLTTTKSELNYLNQKPKRGFQSLCPVILLWKMHQPCPSPLLLQFTMEGNKYPCTTVLSIHITFMQVLSIFITLVALMVI